MQTNVCRLALGEGWESIYTLVYYSHLIPVCIAILLCIFLLQKTKFSFLSIIFSLFTVSFCAWLLGDTIVWTSENFNLINFVWAPLDYINIIFYLFGLYFFVVIINEKDISFWQKLLLFGLSLPAWWITSLSQSITAFNEPVCEALNNQFLSEYKLGIEILVIAFIMFYGFFKGRKSDINKRWQIALVSCALVLFFSIFAVTEYISSETGIYEINLYSLFILPVFLFIIIYAITNLEIFKIRLIGSQLLAYVLIIMVGSQFFFLQNTTHRTLTIVTFLLSLGFVVLLLRSGKREEEARNKVEKLAFELEGANIQLQELDRQKDAVLHMVAHQFKGPVTTINYVTELLLDGTYGQLTDEQKENITSIRVASQNMGDQSQMVLAAAQITLGKKLPIEPAPLDLNVFFKGVITGAAINAKQRKVELHVSVPSNLPTVMLDKKFTQIAVDNLLSNAIKYTALKWQEGGGNVDFCVTVKDKIISCVVKDTGVGIPEKDKDKIFKELSRASNAGKEGTGLGLHVAMGAIESQGGKIWFESTEGKGTTFYCELPLKEVVSK